MKSIESNVWKLNVILGLKSFMLIMPVMVLFFQENRLLMQDVLILQALFSVIVIALDVPTGYFADRVSRKTALIIGGCMSTFGFVVYACSYGFWGFLVAEVLLGIGAGFISGADSAMLYDTLHVLNKENQYLRVHSKNKSIGLFSEGVASVIGGLMATSMSLRAPLWADVATTACIIPLAWSLVEPRFHRDFNVNTQKMSLIAIVKYALHGHMEVAWLIFYASLVTTSTLSMVWFIQPYLVATQVPLSAFGFIWAGLMMVSALCAYHAATIERMLGRKFSLILLIAMPVLGYWATSSLLYSWSFILLASFYIARGIAEPIFSSYINNHIDMDIRATVLSLKSMCGRILFVFTGPIMGWMSDTYSLQMAFGVAAIFFCVCGVSVLCIMWHKNVLE